MEKQGADLKVVKPSPRKDKDWLTRSDHCFAQSTDLHRSDVEAYMEILNRSMSQIRSTPLEHIRSLLLLHDHNGATPISDAERARLTGILLWRPRLLSGSAATSMIDYALLPQEPEENFPRSTGNRKTGNIPVLRSLRINNTAPLRSTPRGSA